MTLQDDEKRRAPTITNEQEIRIRSIPEFANGMYGFLSPSKTLGYFHEKYVANLQGHCDISQSLLIDCACGQGWNALAFVLAGGRKAIGLDTDENKLRIAREISEILNVDDRTAFCSGSISALPLADGSADLFSCIETLEHLDGIADKALDEMNRVARSIVFVTTPNLLFPVVAHDTRLPFAHWLAPKRRRQYARLFRREGQDEGSTFISPFQITRRLPAFRLASQFLGFGSFGEFVSFYPHYLPYVGGGCDRYLPTLQKIVYAMIYALAGQRSFYCLPSLTGIFKRVDDENRR